MCQVRRKADAVEGSTLVNPQPLATSLLDLDLVLVTYQTTSSSFMKTYLLTAFTKSNVHPGIVTVVKEHKEVVTMAPIEMHSSPR